MMQPFVTIAVQSEGQPARIATLDAVVFVVGVALLGWLLVWWGRRIFGEEERP